MANHQENGQRRGGPTFLKEPSIFLPILLAGGFLAFQFIQMALRSPNNNPTGSEQPVMSTDLEREAVPESDVLPPEIAAIVPDSSYKTYGDIVILEKGTVPESGVVFQLFDHLWICATITGYPASNTASELYQNQLGQSAKQILREPHLIVQHTPHNDLVTPTSNIHHARYRMMDEKVGDQGCGLAE